MKTREHEPKRASHQTGTHKSGRRNPLAGPFGNDTTFTPSPPLQAHLFGEPLLPAEHGTSQKPPARSERNTFYHWHYFEFFCPARQSSGVVILSFQDPFSCGSNPREKEIPASIYLTFRNSETHKLTHYAYVVLYGPPAALMRRSFHRFLAFAEPFEWQLSRLGGQTGYHIRMERITDWREPVSSAEPGGRQADSGLEPLHHWHLLHTGPQTPARITLEEETRGGLPRPDQRARTLFDIPTALRIARSARTNRFDHATLDENAGEGQQKASAAQTQTSQGRALRAPCTYWDSNYGSEPLPEFKLPWIWRRTIHGQHSTVHYIFPSERTAWRVENERLSFVQGAAEHADLAPAADSSVAFRHWVTRNAGLTSIIDLLMKKSPLLHEGAPFYLRFSLPAFRALSSSEASRADESEGTRPVCAQSGTEEWMNPKGITTWSTRLLFPLRQTVENNQTFAKHGYAVSLLLTKRNGQSFYVASHILSRNVRRNAYAVYAVCRIVDDATDESRDPQAGSSFSSALIDNLTDRSGGSGTQDLTRPLAGILSRALQISSQHMRKTDAARFLDYARMVMLVLQISKANLRDLVDGQRDDEHFSQPKDFIEFYGYCYKVAGVVGLMMARVFGAPPQPETDQAAEHLGIAMQITNILRDIREDFEDKGRVYLPVDSCAQHGLDLPEAIKEPSGSLPLRRVVTEFAEKAVGYYQSALSGVRDIPGWRERLCVRAMAAIYGSILAVLIGNPERALQGRVVVPRWRKTVIFLMVLVGRDPLAAAGFSRQQRMTRKALPHLATDGLVSRTYSSASRPG